MVREGRGTWRRGVRGDGRKEWRGVWRDERWGRGEARGSWVWGSWVGALRGRREEKGGGIEVGVDLSINLFIYFYDSRQCIKVD